MNYNIEEHRHRFATWAAARAAQRGFTTTSNIIAAIDSTNLREIAMNKSLWPKSKEDFERLHKEWCRKILSELKTTYGRAAKIVAIYLKTIIILSGNENSRFGKILHPPIDRILLSALKKNQNWTQLNEESYFELVKALELENKCDAFWRVERYWRP